MSDKRTTEWKAGNNGAGAHSWFVWRWVDDVQETLDTAHGQVKRFKRKGAIRAAEMANREPVV